MISDLLERFKAGNQRVNVFFIIIICFPFVCSITAVCARVGQLKGGKRAFVIFFINAIYRCVLFEYRQMIIELIELVAGWSFVVEVVMVTLEPNTKIIHTVKVKCTWWSWWSM